MTAAIGKRPVVVAGPNGAGRTTLAREFLPADAGFLTFADADLVAAGLSSFDPARTAIEAGRNMVRQVAEHVERLYKPLVDTWALYDSTTRPATLVEWGEKE